MSQIRVRLAGNSHTLVDQPVTDWKVECSPDEVTLTALMQWHSPAAAHPVLTATSVAYQMEPQVAMRLLAQLHELARSMGWPLPPEAEIQA